MLDILCQMCSELNHLAEGDFGSVQENREKTDHSCLPLQLEAALRADGQGDELGIIYLLGHVHSDLSCSLLFSITEHLLKELGQQDGIPHRILLLTEHQDFHDVCF